MTFDDFLPAGWKLFSVDFSVKLGYVVILENLAYGHSVSGHSVTGTKATFDAALQTAIEEILKSYLGIQKYPYSSKGLPIESIIPKGFKLAQVLKNIPPMPKGYSVKLCKSIGKWSPKSGWIGYGNTLEDAFLDVIILVKESVL